MIDASELLAGPRGRWLCWQLLDPPYVRTVDVALSHIGATADAARPAADDDETLIAALRFSVDVAKYWQPPDDDELLLADADVTAALLPVAEAVLTSEAAQWWRTGIDLERQRVVGFADERTAPPGLPPPGVAQRLADWRIGQLQRGRKFRAIRMGDPEQYGSMSANWWATPDRGDVVFTARDRPDGPVGLWAVEDELGWRRADVLPVTPTRPVRVVEVDGPDAWCDLVRRYPLDAEAQGPDWARTTGADGPWLLPDWPAVAEDIDAVHVTVLGYLTAAGRALPVDDRLTVLAGWAPDETCWLTDDLRATGAAEPWQADEEARWTRGPCAVSDAPS